MASYLANRAYLRVVPWSFQGWGETKKHQGRQGWETVYGKGGFEFSLEEKVRPWGRCLQARPLATENLAHEWALGK